MATFIFNITFVLIFDLGSFSRPYSVLADGLHLQSGWGCPFFSGSGNTPLLRPRMTPTCAFTEVHYCRYDASTRPHFTQTYCTVRQTCPSVWVNKTRWLPGKWFAFSLPEHLFHSVLWKLKRTKGKSDWKSEWASSSNRNPSIHPPTIPPQPRRFFPPHSVLRHDFALCPAQHGMLISRKLL